VVVEMTVQRELTLPLKAPIPNSNMLSVETNPVRQTTQVKIVTKQNSDFMKNLLNLEVD
jgi:hypothetical protein